MALESLKRPIQLKLTLPKRGPLGGALIPCGLDERPTKFSQLALDGTLLKFLHCAFYLVVIRRALFGQQRLCQQRPLAGIFDHFHRVAGLADGQRLHRCERGKVLKPSRFLLNGLGRQTPSVGSFHVGIGQSAQQHALHFSERSGTCLYVVAPLERCLPQLFAQHR